MKNRFPYRILLQWVIVLTIFVVLGKMVWENWDQVKETSFSLRFFPLLLSTLIFVLSYFIQIWAWYLITLKLGVAIPFGETTASWFFSQLGKYLPGKVWLFLSRLYLYDSRGKSKKTITVALYFEVVTLLMAAGLISWVSLLFLKGVRSSYFGISAFRLTFIFIPVLFFLHPKVLQRLFNRILTFLKREPISLSISYSDLLWVLGISVLSWVVGGIGFYFFVDSVFPLPSGHVPYLTGALAISSTLGLVALFAPGGLGVREGVLVYLLSSIMPSPVAVILSVLTRLWMTFIEIGLIGVVYLVSLFRRKGKE